MPGPGASWLLTPSAAACYRARLLPGRYQARLLPGPPGRPGLRHELPRQQ